MDLKELLGEDMYNQLMAKLGDKHKVAIVSDGNWIPKDKFNEANTAKKQVEDTLKERDKQLEEIKKSSGDSAALQEQITKLQAENKTASEKYASDMKELQLNSALKMVLTSEAHDPTIVASLLDKSKIELDDSGAVKGGLDDQIKSLRESKAFLFVNKQDTKPRFKGTNPLDGKDQSGGGGESSAAADFAKAANESGKAPASANNPWG
ncbi:scaffold protein [Paenibacillus baekrokdamisoli]|uniref:Scaffold protein n=1 Tax=Paenibacillus baekrokdamisoli TaxID=1712516 RepID=A0A3G9JA13_9BACL|nr:phage scaffolding protein [Paenibacillus baekrokdamisoli]MBB3070469.1 alanyl-tRNA synthetase [Paenibacillus baekrokdamisoli]BBH19819.1 scaffold protein [Paenibacillus baekrokdamisoli]